MKSARWIVPVLSLALVLGFTLWDVLRSDAGPGPVHPRTQRSRCSTAAATARAVTSTARWRRTRACGATT